MASQQRSLKKGGPRMNSPSVGPKVDGIIGARKVNDPWQTKGSMDEILRYEPEGGGLNPSKTAIIGSRARGL